MGGGMGTGFGRTKGEINKDDLDKLSRLLSILSLIPVADTAFDAASFFVDLEEKTI